MIRFLAIFLSLILLAGCGAGVNDYLTSGADFSVSEKDTLAESEMEREEDAKKSELESSSEPSISAEWKRFEQITNRPLSEWITKDFLEIFSMSGHELDLSKDNNIGFEHFVFDIMGANISFPNGTHYMIESEYPRGFLIYEKYKDEDVVKYPLIITIVSEEQSTLLGADLGGNISDIMDVFGQTEVEYVIRKVGKEIERFYFIRYSIGGLVFLFECGIPSDLRTGPSHPTTDEVLTSKLWYVDILKEDCYLLEQLNAFTLNQ